MNVGESEICPGYIYLNTVREAVMSVSNKALDMLDEDHWMLLVKPDKLQVFVHPTL